MPRSCKPSTRAKYHKSSRKGPPYPANSFQCRGTRKRGNDGRMYESRMFNKRTGAFRWFPVTNNASPLAQASVYMAKYQRDAADRRRAANRRRRVSKSAKRPQARGSRKTTSKKSKGRRSTKAKRKTQRR